MTGADDPQMPYILTFKPDLAYKRLETNETARADHQAMEGTNESEPRISSFDI